MPLYDDFAENKIYILIQEYTDEYGHSMTEDNIGAFSTFEKAYSVFMNSRREDNFGNRIYYLIEEWEIDGERKNVHRY